MRLDETCSCYWIWCDVSCVSNELLNIGCCQISLKQLAPTEKLILARYFLFMNIICQDENKREPKCECRMFENYVFWTLLLLNLAVKPCGLCNETMAVR